MRLAAGAVWRIAKLIDIRLLSSVGTVQSRLVMRGYGGSSLFQKVKRKSHPVGPLYLLLPDHW